MSDDLLVLCVSSGTMGLTDTRIGSIFRIFNMAVLVICMHLIVSQDKCSDEEGLRTMSLFIAVSPEKFRRLYH